MSNFENLNLVELNEFINIDNINKKNKLLYSQWILTEKYKLYLRINKLNKSITIAVIEVEESLRGKGIGTFIINYIVNNNPYNKTIIESVNNPDLYRSLIKKGWLEDENIPFQLYKIV